MKAIPTLSSSGWVRTMEERGDAALAYFFASEHSQSTLYYGRVASLQYLIKQYGHDPLELETQIGSVLESLMRRYLSEDVQVIVKVEEPDPAKPGHLSIRFSCYFKENDREYSLARRVEFFDGRLSRIIKENQRS